MIGKFISGVVRLATLPVDIAEIGLDLATGGDGSRDELEHTDLPIPSKFRDAVCDTIERIDK